MKNVIMIKALSFCINLTIILYFLNMDEASRTKRPGEKLLWDEMARYEMVLVRGVLDLIRAHTTLCN